MYKWFLKKKLFQEAVFDLPDDIIDKLDDIEIPEFMLNNLLNDLNKQLGVEKVTKLIESGKILEIIKDLLREGHYTGYDFILELKRRLLLLV